MDKEKIKILKAQADEAKASLKLGFIDYAEAKKMASPYVKAFNEKSREIAKKYNQRPRTINVASYLR